MAARGWILAGAMALSALFPAGASPAAAVPAAISNARVTEGEASTRIEITASGPVEEKAFLLDAPDRFVVDLKDARLSISGTPSPGGLVRAVRYGRRPNGDVRLVFDLSAPVTLSRAGPLSFDLSPRTPVLAGEPASVIGAAPPAVQSRPPRRLVVVDAGHGGKDPGALGARVKEKEVVLAAALTLREELEERGYEVALTRGGDVFLELEDRVRFARDRKADLFISLHADASSSPNAQGASVYTLSEQGGDRAKAMMRSQDWKLDQVSGYSGAVESILVDLAQRETTNRSADFAQTLIRTLGPNAPLLRRTHRSAGYFVLLAPDVPAVLLEMGFMTNAEDERRLSSETQRASMMKSVADAIDIYFDRPRAYAGPG